MGLRCLMYVSWSGLTDGDDADADWQCVDIEFADPKDVEEVTRDNCFNSSDLEFNLIYATKPIEESAASRVVSGGMMMIPVVVAGLMSLL